MLQSNECKDSVLNNPGLAYHNYYKDLKTYNYYNCTYEQYITHMKDKMLLDIHHVDDINVNQSLFTRLIMWGIQMMTSLIWLTKSTIAVLVRMRIANHISVVWLRE